MKIVKCPNCSHVFAVPYEGSMATVKYRCPNPECHYTDYDRAFLSKEKMTGVENSGSVLYESAAVLASNFHLITEENIVALARNNGCSVKVVVSLLNHLLDSGRNVTHGVVERLRYAVLEQELVSAEDILEEVRTAVRAATPGDRPVSQHTEEDVYKDRYFSLKEDYDKLQSEKKNLLARLRSLSEENKEYKQILGY